MSQKNFYTSNVCAQDRNCFYKDIQNLHEFRVKRKNITIKINIWIIFRIKKIIIHFKRIILHRFEVCFRSHLSFFTDLIFEKSCKITQNYALSLCDHYFVQYQLMSALFNTSLCLFRSAFLGFLL